MMSDPAVTIASQRTESGFFQFAAKALVIAAVFTASAVFVANWVIESAEDAAARSIDRLEESMRNAPLSGSQFWGKVERELDRAADPKTDLPPEKKEKLIKDLHVITARWRPFVEAVVEEIQKPSAPLPQNQ
jgi:hypothetical protein